MGNASKRLRREKKQKAAKTTRIVLIIFSIVLALALIGALIFALIPDKVQNSESGKAGNNGSDNASANNGNKTEGKSYGHVTLNVSYTDKNGNSHTGDIVIELRDDCAPITVANFKKLVSEGYYDGTDFFRIVEGFMIQGGENDSMTADYIKGEFALNGVNNPLKHVRGTVSMARLGDNYDGSAITYSDGVVSYNSASSGFFIVQEDYTYGDGQYAAFGTVVAGMEHVDAIAGTELVSSDKYQGAIVAPKYPAIINSATLQEASN